MTLAILGFIFLCALAWWLERREWNHGACRAHGNMWIYFDTDSQGGKGFKCHPEIMQGCVAWISWPFILPKEIRRESQVPSPK